MPLLIGKPTEREGQQEGLALMLRFRENLSQRRGISELDYKVPYHISEVHSCDG